ncbi:hypothetical protein A7L77_18895, partial [Acinetobacter baumannii]|uniref:ribosomal protein S19 family protein n=1 Tax=Acinetobacter baumannii TaxID=470 RepID=UPI0008DCF5EB
MICLLKKNFFVVNYLLRKINKFNIKVEKNLIVMWFWVFIIIFIMIGYIIVIYNGKEYLFVYIIDCMVGYKLGEFV